MMGCSIVQFKYRRTIPLAVPYLAYGMEKAGIDFDLKIFDVGKFYEPGSGRVDALYHMLTGTRDIVALGCFSDVLPYAISALKKLKKNFPEKTVILGGVGPSSVASEIVETFDFVDFIVRDCGINPLPLLIGSIRENKKQFDHIPRLVYRDGRNVRETFDDYSYEIPKSPVYDKIDDIEKYDRFLIKTSTGCPYQCTFCYALPAAGRKVRYRDIGEVIGEIGRIREINKENNFILRILDEAFVFNRKRVIEFCRAMKKNNPGVLWVCYGRIDRMDEELLKIMADANCMGIYFGVESGSDRILEKIKKGFTTEDSFKTVLLTKKYIPSVVVSFIYRYPFETRADFKETLFALRYFQIRDVTIQLHPLVPVRNSDIYANYSDQLRFSDKEPCDYMDSNPLDFLPAECVDLIRSNPRVFYDYAHYSPPELDEINETIAKNRDVIYTNYYKYWSF